MLNMKNTVLPILAVLALCIGNFLRLGEEEISAMETAFFGIATAVATLVGMYGVWKDNKTKEEAEKVEREERRKK